MNEIVRIYGDKLGEEDYFVDAVVTNVDLEGIVHLEEDVTDSPRSWTITLDEYCNLRDNDYAGKHSDLSDPSHAIWSGLEDLYALRNDEVISDMATALDTNGEDLFRSAIRSMKGE